MKIENQVVSLELAKKLKELGFKQRSLFYYYGILVDSPECKSATPSFELHYNTYNEGREYRYYSLNDRIPAYTVAELGEILPNSILLKEGHQHTYLEMYISDNCGVGYNDLNGSQHFEKSETEANARAKMLIYLKENKLI